MWNKHLKNIQFEDKKIRKIDKGMALYQIIEGREEMIISNSEKEEFEKKLKKVSKENLSHSETETKLVDFHNSKKSFSFEFEKAKNESLIEISSKKSILKPSDSTKYKSLIELNLKDTFLISNDGLDSKDDSKDSKIKIPISNCSHIFKENKDRTPLGHFNFKAVTSTQFFSLIWENKFYNQSVSEHFEHTDCVYPEWAFKESSCCLKRLVTYKMPLDIPFAPKITRIESEQFVRYDESNRLVFESNNFSLDVPFGDSFYVNERYIVDDLKKSSINVDVSIFIIWKKSAWGLKGTINQRSVRLNISLVF